VAVLWRAGRKTEALEAAEQFRARAFLDLMASRTAGNERNVFSDPPSPDKLAAYAKRAHRALLSYWVHPEAVYIWLVDGEGHIHSARTAIAESRVKLLAERARKFSYTPDREAWRSLHRLLIQPLEAWLPKGDDQSLTLLPHGALLQLPFAALLDPAGRYLGEKYILRVAPAAGFLVREAAPPAGAGELVLVGASRSAGLPALPGARRELEMVAALSPGSRLLSGEAAQEAQVRAAAQRARVLHFATHAIVDEGAPFESYLALSGSQKLTAAEIYNLRLHADLVVLSACRSGSGKVSADGLVGFTRAFLYAGAASVLAPLWDIPDEPTVRLVEEFYRQYRGGANKAQALRAAQLKLLAELRSGKFTVATPAGPMSLPEHPAIWAGFVIQGDE
jgi:CHAT domain-containing protein